MTYPPQQPGPYGQDPYGQQQPPQTPPYGGQSSYQGLGSYGTPPPPPPKKRNTGMIVAIIVIVVLVLGGGGVALVVLNKDDKPAAQNNNQTQAPKSNDPTTSPSNDNSTSSDPSSDSTSGNASNTPDDVRDAYMAAYESKSFTEVVSTACAAYKSKYGTDTSELESTLAPYDITATASGSPSVNGNTATANIDLQLSKGGTTEKPSIFIKIVEEGGQWRFCGEGEA
ncbi:hypothetical protein [Actinophytocola sp.]|jgi:hypothetical protein|uniref:hypothetical protein n=1 Tax=Actinophytocola sp. TaxID=1872138 RepID=UPI002ED8FEDD